MKGTQANHFVAEFDAKSATGNAQSADAGNERETYDVR